MEKRGKCRHLRPEPIVGIVGLLKIALLALVPLLPAVVRGDGEVRVGDSRERVIAVLGEPSGTSVSAEDESLLYKNGWVDLTRGAVVSVNLREPVASEKADQARRRAEQERLEFRRRIEERLAENAKAAALPSPGELLAVEEAGAPNMAPAGQEEPPSPPPEPEPIDVPEALIEREIRLFIGSEHSVTRLHILSQEDSGDGVRCIFVATVRGRRRSRLPGNATYSGPVRGSIELRAVEDTIHYTGQVQSVPAGRFRREGSGTITMRKSRR